MPSKKSSALEIRFQKLIAASAHGKSGAESRHPCSPGKPSPCVTCTGSGPVHLVDSPCHLSFRQRRRAAHVSSRASLTSTANSGSQNPRTGRETQEIFETENSRRMGAGSRYSPRSRPHARAPLPATRNPTFPAVPHTRHAPRTGFVTASIAALVKNNRPKDSPVRPKRECLHGIPALRDGFARQRTRARA